MVGLVLHRAGLARVIDLFAISVRRPVLTGRVLAGVLVRRHNDALSPEFMMVDRHGSALHHAAGGSEVDGRSGSGDDGQDQMAASGLVSGSRSSARQSSYTVTAPASVDSAALIRPLSTPTQATPALPSHTVSWFASLLALCPDHPSSPRSDQAPVSQPIDDLR